MTNAPSSAIVTALERFFAEGGSPGVVSAYLYGSQASGRVHRESDVDVGVLLAYPVHPRREGRFEERLRLSSRLAGALRAPEVDVVVLNDVPPGLGRHVVTTGRRVFCSNPEADHAFVRDVQLRAADLEPFLQRARRLKLDAIAR